VAVTASLVTLASDVYLESVQRGAAERKAVTEEGLLESIQTCSAWRVKSQSRIRRGFLFNDFNKLS